MDLHDEVRVGNHTYGVRAKSEPAQDGEPSRVAVEFTGADSDGRIIAEGNLLVAFEAISDSGSFLARSLDGLATLHGHASVNRTARPRPPNAGRAWSAEHTEQLRDRWLRSTAVTAGHELIGELAQEYGRTRGAVRAQLPRLGCDPDVPGRALVEGPAP